MMAGGLGPGAERKATIARVMMHKADAFECLQNPIDRHLIDGVTGQCDLRMNLLW